MVPSLVSLTYYSTWRRCRGWRYSRDCA